MAKYKIASLFAGIGGIDYGFEQAGAKCIWANEIDKNCASVYILNHNNKLVVDDICNIKGQEIPKIDILAGGFPCQPFSIAGCRKGFEDDRGNMFHQIMRIVDEMKQNDNKPRIVFLENVKNLQSHDNGQAYGVIKKELEKRKYLVTEKILNTCEYGNIPQNRERIFIVAFANKKDFEKFSWDDIPKIPCTQTLEKIINWDENVDSKYIYNKSIKCYPLLKETILQKGIIYQYRRVYVRTNKKGVCPTLTANMGMGGHNVPIILDNQEHIRKLLPRECLALQGFPSDMKIPTDLSDSKIYKQAGNAVSVPVVKRVATEILKAMDKTDKEISNE